MMQMFRAGARSSVWSASGRRAITVIFAALLTMGFVTAAMAEHRVALVIGNAAYQHVPALRNPAHDATAVGATLRNLDFDVTVVTDADKVGMEQALRHFAAELAGADVALFYYSGHAVQVDEQNYLVPVSAAVEGEKTVVLDTIALQDVSDILRRADVKVQLLFLDACRDNPFGPTTEATRSLGAGRGLARIDAGTGSLVAFSTAPGREALDGAGSLSPFTDAFVRYAVKPDLEIRQMLSRVRVDVTAATSNRQVPWDNSSLLSDFFLVPKRQPPQFEHLAHVTIGKDREPLALHLAAPVQPEGGALELSVRHQPSNGRLRVGPREIGAGDKLTPDAFEHLAYEATGDSLSDLFDFDVADAWGNHDVGVVVVSRQDGAGAPPSPVDRPFETLRGAAISLLGIGPNLIFRNDLDVPSQEHERRITLASNLPFGQIVLGDRVIEQGRSLAVSDLPKLAFNPPLNAAGQHLDATFLPEDKASGEVKIGIDVAMTDCDRLAGDRLDKQGVGEGVLTENIDTTAALPACQTAVKARSSVARFSYELGRVYAALGRESEAVSLFHTAADLGYVRALTALGYRDVFVPPTDLARGKATLEKAAAAGDIYAVHTLGKIYYDGRGVPQDFAQARALFEQAARMGHTYSMNALGRMYQRGEAVPVDFAMTRRYWSEAADRGDIYGIDNMGFVYLDGIGVAKDPAKALDYFKRAAALGHPEAPNDVGRLYVLGLGVPVDYAAARRWDQIGADRGDAWASYNLAELARLGRGGPVDPVEAGYYYARAAASVNQLDVSELGRKQLLGLDRKTKIGVLGRLIADIDPGQPARDAKQLPAYAAGLLAAKHVAAKDESLDSLVFATAQAVWVAKNRRFDLF